METSVNVLSLVFSGLAMTALLSISGVAATGKARRRQWMLETQNMERAGNVATQGQIQRTQRAQRASDFLSDLIRRIYFIMTMVAASALTVLPSMTVEASTRILLWLGLTGVAYVGAALLLFYWHGWEDEREALLRRKLRHAQERALSLRGLIVRDELTQLYTPEFWSRELNRRVRRTIRRQMPVTCLRIELEGLEAFRDKHGDHADDVIYQVGQVIGHNVRADDLVCSYGGGRFAVALFRCPARFGRSIAARVENNVGSLALIATNQRYGSRLRLQWALATLPASATTSTKLLRVTRRALDRKKIWASHDAAPNEAGFPFMWRAQPVIAG